MYHPFSVTETISIAWHILKKNFATIAVYCLLAVVLIGGAVFALNFLLDDVIAESVALFITIVGVSFIFLGYIKLVFRLIDKEYYDFDFSEIVPKFKMLLSYLILLVIVSTITVFMKNAIARLPEGLLQSLLGIFAAIFFEFFFLFYFPICTCFIMDDDSGPFESVVQSFHLIKGSFFKYFLLFLLIEALVFIGSLTVIGIIFVVPFVNILLVVAYRKLVYSRIDADDEIAETL